MRDWFVDVRRKITTKNKSILIQGFSQTRNNRKVNMFKHVNERMNAGNSTRSERKTRQVSDHTKLVDNRGDKRAT
jgi:hypothetical protein